MKHLTWTERKAVLDKLTVFLRAKPLEYLTTTVFIITKKRVPDMLHVYAYLVRATGLQLALHERHVRELLQHTPMRHGFFGLRTLLQIPHAVDRSVPIVPRQRTFHRTALLFERTPHQRVIRALGRVVEELLGEVRLRFRCLGDKQETGGVFVYTMYQTYFGIVDI